jgi:hypothetical protein
MVIATIVFLSICLIVSIVINFLLYKAAQIQLHKSWIYENWIFDLKSDVEETYLQIKDIDNKQWFQSEDDVGEVFRSITDLITHLNERTQEIEGEENQ